MNEVRLSRGSLERVERDARHSYPDEACGFLFAAPETSSSGAREVLVVEPAPNEYRGERSRRFVIVPEQLRAAEAEAARRGQVVGGFYHSHPDHAAVPSEFDTEHAWPWYAYLVVAVDRSGQCEAAAFELDSESGRFQARPLRLTEDLRAGADERPLSARGA